MACSLGTVRQVTRSKGTAVPKPLPGREKERPGNRYPNSDGTQRPSELTALLKPSVAGQQGRSGRASRRSAAATPGTQPSTVRGGRGPHPDSVPTSPARAWRPTRELPLGAGAPRSSASVTERPRTRGPQADPGGVRGRGRGRRRRQAPMRWGEHDIRSAGRLPRH